MEYFTTMWYNKSRNLGASPVVQQLSFSAILRADRGKGADPDVCLELGPVVVQLPAVTTLHDVEVLFARINCHLITNMFANE